MSTPAEPDVERLAALMRVAERLLGHPLPNDVCAAHASTLQELASLPEARWAPAARRTLSKRGSLDPVWWLRLADEDSPTHASGQEDLRELLKVGRRLLRLSRSASTVGSAGQMQGAARSERGARASGKVCLACGSVMDLESVCGCRRSENAGRCDN